MGLDVEHRPSPSPHVARVWRATGEQTVAEMTAVAYARWDLVFWDVDGAMHVSVVGPSVHASTMPVPDATISFGINFELGTVLPQLLASRVVDGVAQLPDVTRRGFRLAGSTWDLPTYDNAEAFVAALVREEVVVRDPLVADLHRDAAVDLSSRTAQRRFLAATGLTRGTARQIDRGPRRGRAHPGRQHGQRRHRRARLLRPRPPRALVAALHRPVRHRAAGEHARPTAVASVQDRRERRFIASRSMRVVISEFISLDGVVQAPGGADEDPSGGFRHGGWSMPYFDPEVMGTALMEAVERTDAALQGRRTYEISAASWPERTDDDDPFSTLLNKMQKYVVSDTLTEDDLTWGPATLVRPAVLLDTVAELRDQPGRDLAVTGSTDVARALLAADLVDELSLVVEPIVLGGGKTIFPDGGDARPFELVSTIRANTGVLLNRYQRVR